MSDKPKIGIIFITSAWFRDIGLQSADSDLSGEVEKIGSEIVEKLSEFIEPVYQGVLFSVSGAKQAAKAIKHADVDGLIISPLMWCEDQILRAALKELPKSPLLLCTFIPFRTLPEYLEYNLMLKGSGTVGTLQVSGFLKREGYVYQTVTGYYKDAGMYETIKDYCNASMVSSSLKNTVCGLVPFPCNQMSTTFIDEFKIRSLYGVELKYYELSLFHTTAQKITADEISVFKKTLVDMGYSIEVDEENLNEGIKYALAMEKILRQDNINIFSMNDTTNEMHSLFGLRPSLYNPNLTKMRLVVSMEYDIAAGLGMYILLLFTGHSPFYTEVLTVDLERNALILGHAGYHEAINYDERYGIKIVPDIEYKNSDKYSGAVINFKYKPGDVTLVNCVYNGEKLRLTVLEAESVDCPPKLEGTCHLFCILKLPVEEFFTRVVDAGVSQHWLVIPGKYAQNLERLCQFNDIGYIKL
jgi:L-arabinose isomerase